MKMFSKANCSEKSYVIPAKSYRSHEMPDASREILNRSRKVCAPPLKSQRSAKCWTAPASPGPFLKITVVPLKC